VVSNQLPPTTTCSNVTRALIAKADTALSKGDSVERTVRTPDGRTLAVEESGDLAGRPVLVHMGTPNSRHLYGPNVRDAASRGLRLISYDRPGYGGSSPQPGRTVADCAADVRIICAELGIARLATWGISGGGPHVLACAALLPDLVTAAASLASLAPFDADGLDRMHPNDAPVTWCRGLMLVRASSVAAVSEGDLRPYQAAACPG
jgi:pimeloyl-ACP methyl ester carboxylesterase